MDDFGLEHGGNDEGPDFDLDDLDDPTEGDARADRRPRTYWRQQVRQFASSGLTVREYCAQHDLHPSTFRCWLGRLGVSARSEVRRAAARDVDAAELEVDPMDLAVHEVALIEHGDLAFSFPTSADPEWVGKVFLEVVAAC